MAPGRESGGGLGRQLRRLVTAALLLGIGVSLGIVTGAVSDLPELLYRRMREPVQVVELSGKPTDPKELRALGELGTPVPPASQRRAELEARPALPPAAATAPPPQTPKPQSPLAPDPAPARTPVPPRPPPPAVASRPATQAPTTPPTAARVIEEIARRRGAVASSKNVVQVASYTDGRAADALAARLRRKGFDSFVSKTSTDGVDRFRVRVRPDPRRDEKTLAADLAREGLSVWVTSE